MECLSALTRCYLQTGELPVAHECAMLAFLQEPDSPELQFQAGVASLACFQHSEGLALLRAAIRREPRRRDALKDLPLRPEELEDLLTIPG